MNWDYSRHYGRFHTDTPEHDANLHAMFERWLRPYLPADKNAAILDVGCGRGYAMSWLANSGFTKLQGIDVDVGQVEFARSRGLNVQHVTDSVAFLDTRPTRFDFVLLMDVLEHMPRPHDRMLLETIQRTLRPGGRLLCTVPNALSPLANYWRHIDYTHETTFTPESLDFLIGHAGFEIEGIHPLEIVPPPRGFPFTKATLRSWILRLSRLQPRLSCIGEFGWRNGRRMPLSPNLLAVCRR
jgi:SAM-dependent methyltransferase